MADRIISSKLVRLRVGKTLPTNKCFRQFLVAAIANRYRQGQLFQRQQTAMLEIIEIDPPQLSRNIPAGGGGGMETVSVFFPSLPVSRRSSLFNVQ